MFDELKIKSLLKKDLTGEKYSSLSYKIKSDPRIIEHLIKCSPSSISLVDKDVSSYVKSDPSLIVYLSQEQLNDCFSVIDFSSINMSKEIFDKFNWRNRDTVFRMMPSVCLGYYSVEDRREIIGKIAMAKYKNATSDDMYDIFTDEEFKDLLLNLSKEDFVSMFHRELYVKKYMLELVSTFDEEMVAKLILPLTEVYEDLPPMIKNRVDFVNANGDIDKILASSEDVQLMYFLRNMDDLCYADWKIAKKCLMICANPTADLLLKHTMTRSNDVISCLSKDEQDILFSRNFFCVYEATHWHDSQLKMDTIMRDKLLRINDVEKRKRLIALYNDLGDDEVVRGDSYIYHNEKHQISRMLYDTNIVNNNSADMLEKYARSFDRKLLIEILVNAYGEHVKEFFEERPYLDILNIDNFKIFDREIYDKLGPGFIHYTFNCEQFMGSDLIGKLSMDHELLDKFADYFNCMTKDVENLDNTFITNIIEKFIKHEEIIREIDFDNISEERKNNLSLLIRDDAMLSNGISTIEELDNYLELRKQRFEKLCQGIDNSSDMKEVIFAYVFGRNVSEDSVLEELSFEKALSVFNIHNLVNNEEIIEKMGLSKDEVAMLLLMHEIERTRNIDVLKDVFKSLVSRDLSSVLFASTFDKIKAYYVEDIKNGLLTNAKLDSMPKKMVNGVEVVTFEGEEFTTICSVIGLNLSGRYMARALHGKNLLNSWLNREEGYNAISTALVSSDTEIYPVDERVWISTAEHVTFIFDDSVDIIGMGATDIAAEHQERARKHTFGFIGCSDKDTGFSTMDELKSRINVNKRETGLGPKFQSEIAISRKEEDIREDKGGLKRTMPIAMYVIGEISPEHLETARIFNEYYEKNGLGKFRIVQVDPKVYRGEGRINASSKSLGVEASGKSI